MNAARSLYIGGHIPAANSSSVSTVEILVYAPGATGAAQPTAILPLGGLYDDLVGGLDVDAAGNVYISSYVIVGSGSAGRVDPGNDRLLPFSKHTFAQSRVIAEVATTILLDTPVAAESSGNIYVSRRVQRLGPAKSARLWSESQRQRRSYRHHRRPEYHHLPRSRHRGRHRR